MPISKEQKKLNRERLIRAGFSKEFADKHKSGKDVNKYIVEMNYITNNRKVSNKIAEQIIEAKYKRNKQERIKALDNLTGRAKQIYVTEMMREQAKRYGVKFTREDRKEINMMANQHGASIVEREIKKKIWREYSIMDDYKGIRKLDGGKWDRIAKEVNRKKGLKEDNRYGYAVAWAMYVNNADLKTAMASRQPTAADPEIYRVVSTVQYVPSV